MRDETDRGSGDDRPALTVGTGELQDEQQTPAGQRRYRRRTTGVFVLATLLVGFLAIVSVAGQDDVSAAQTAAPRPFSALEPVTIDARTELPSRTEAEIVESCTMPEFGGLAAIDDEFVAVAVDDDGLGLFRSSDGASWGEFARLFAPPEVDLATRWGVSQFQLFEVDGAIVVFGRIGNRLAVWVNGEYMGFVEDIQFSYTPVIVAGDQLLAVATLSSDGESAALADERWFMSSNGVDWDEVVPDGFPEAGAHIVGAADGVYYATENCWLDPCELPLLLRSADGVTWGRVAPDLPSLDGGTLWGIHDLTQAEDRALAVGTIGVGTRWEPAIWESADGDTWALAPLGGVFDPLEATIELVSTNTVVKGVALVSVNGVAYEVSEESVIQTDVGRLRVGDVNADSVRLTLGSEGPALFHPGEVLVVSGTPSFSSIMTDGPRIAILGGLNTRVEGSDLSRTRIPTLWVSADGGTTWKMSSLAEPGGVLADSLALTEHGVVVAGVSDAGSTVLWRIEMGN